MAAPAYDDLTEAEQKIVDQAANTEEGSNVTAETYAFAAILRKVDDREAHGDAMMNYARQLQVCFDESKGVAGASCELPDFADRLKELAEGKASPTPPGG